MVRSGPFFSASWFNPHHGFSVTDFRLLEQLKKKASLFDR